MITSVMAQALDEWADLLGPLRALEGPLQQLADAAQACWSGHGKLLIAGNGGSAADAMHLAEELVVRFRANRRALAAMALSDPAVVTCCGNDFGYEQVFARQIEALGNPGDLLILFSTSGNSANLLRAVEQARRQNVATAAFLGNDGGKLKGRCDIELLVRCATTARVQEAHKLLFHILCEWVDQTIAQEPAHGTNVESSLQ